MAEILIDEDGLVEIPAEVQPLRWRAQPHDLGYYWRSNPSDPDHPMVLIFYAGNNIYWILTDIWTFNIEIEEFRVDIGRNRESGNPAFYGPIRIPVRPETENMVVDGITGRIRFEPATEEPNLPDLQQTIQNIQAIVTRPMQNPVGEIPVERTEINVAARRVRVPTAFPTPVFTPVDTNPDGTNDAAEEAPEEVVLNVQFDQEIAEVNQDVVETGETPEAND